MTILIAGVALWLVGHMSRRLLRTPRKMLGRLEAPLDIMASILAIALMIIGYRRAEIIPLWSLGGWAIWVNNLMMAAAVVLNIVPMTRNRLRERLRHPIMTGTMLWAGAHLLANGDVASVILFLPLGLGAVGAVMAINSQDPVYTPWSGATKKGDLMLVALSVAVFAVIVWIHWLLGYWPLAL